MVIGEKARPQFQPKTVRGKGNTLPSRMKKEEMSEKGPDRKGGMVGKNGRVKKVRVVVVGMCERRAWVGAC
jgi:hypothetical protein